MIEERTGDILQVTSGIILHQVNCQGVMGSGVAKQIRAKYQVVYNDYSDFLRHRTPEEALGKILVTPVSDKLKIISLFAQLSFGTLNGKRYTSYDALDTALNKIDWFLPQNEPSDIHFPYIGCGLGGGKWSVVSNIIESNLARHNLYLWRF